MSKSILVLGPAGNVGSPLAEILLRRGLPVRAGNRRDFDFFKPETYRAAFREVQAVFLVTPVVPQMVELTSELVKACAENGVGKIVKLSALGVEEKDITLFRLHKEAEEIVRASGIPAVYLRPNAFMQNFPKHYSRMLKALGGLYLPAAQAKISFVDAWDIAAVAAECICSPHYDGQALEITGPAALSFDDAAGILSSVLGKKIPYCDIPEEKAKAGMLKNGVPPWTADALTELYRFYRSGKAERVAPTMGQVVARPGRNFAEYVSAHRGDFL